MKNLYKVVEGNKTIARGYELLGHSIKYFLGINGRKDNNYAFLYYTEYINWYRKNYKKYNDEHPLNFPPREFLKMMINRETHLIDEVVLEFMELVKLLIGEDIEAEVIYGEKAFNPNQHNYKDWKKNLNKDEYYILDTK